jgi:hypothetical protein
MACWRGHSMHSSIRYIPFNAEYMMLCRVLNAMRSEPTWCPAVRRLLVHFWNHDKITRHSRRSEARQIQARVHSLNMHQLFSHNPHCDGIMNCIEWCKQYAEITVRCMPWRLDRCMIKTLKKKEIISARVCIELFCPNVQWLMNKCSFAGNNGQRRVKRTTHFRHS